MGRPAAFITRTQVAAVPENVEGVI